MDAGERARNGKGSVPHAARGAAACVLIGLAALALALALGGVSPAAALAVLAPILGATALAGLALDRLRGERDELAAAAERARRLADQDGLTGVGNYRAFWRALRAECARAERHGGGFTLAVIDLDDFKRVNDEHGHLAGDATLRAVADALRDAVRAEDVLCRQGGDEFAVVAVAAGDREASPLAGRLASAVAAAQTDPGMDWRPAASVGTATYGIAGTTPEQIMESAEASLAAAKSASHVGGGYRRLGSMAAG